MTRLELQDNIRRLLDDLEKPFKWSDDELISYINSAFNEIAKRTLCIKDSISPLTSIAMVANQRHYAYPEGVLQILSVTKSWDGRELKRTTLETERDCNPLWLSSTSEPAKFMTDYNTDTISLVGVLPAVTTQTLNITCHRMPAALNDDTSVSDVPSRFHEKIYNWCLYLAFSKQDSELYNPQKAKFHLTGFEGQREDQGQGGDIGQIIMQVNQFEPHGHYQRYF